MIFKTNNPLRFKISSKRTYAIRLLVLCLIGFVSTNVLAQGNYVYPPRKKVDKYQVLYLGGGHWHDDLSNAAAIRDHLENTLKNYFVIYSEDPNSIKSIGKNCDVIIIHSMLFDWDKKVVKSLLKIVEKGTPLLAIHGATAAFRDESHPKYFEMLGGNFDGHPPYDGFNVYVKNKQHPVMDGITDFYVEDEMYAHKNFDPNNIVLLEGTMDGETKPLAWVKNYGKGKVLYLSIGHDHATNRNPIFLKILENGLHWALDETKSGEWYSLR